ncbi:MAG: efflux RND transporter periplasmic adaptor subunit [Betaproteobacteria bacterium]|nr:efflux RND transporter periplasmic adaptor subunit [Betaproteobacteria bacterium]
MKTNIEIRSFFKGLGLLLGMVLGLALAHAQTQSASNGPAIQVIAAGQKSVSNFNDIDGVVEAVMQSTLSSQIAGRVLSLNVKAGDRVKAGQVLATIDDRETQTGVLRSQAQLQQSDAELRQLQIALKRTQDLKAQGFVSAAALDLAEAQYKAAQAGRDSAGATTQQAKVAQSYSKITAPYDAWVLETSAQAGDLALPGKPLMTVYAPQPLRVVMQWPASEKNSLPKLQDIQIQMGTETVKPVAMQVMPNADGVSQTIGIKLDLPRTGVALQAAPGMQVLQWMRFKLA